MKPTQPEMVRLQKFLSDTGVASRRHAEELILEGHVLVNGRIADTLPTFVDPRHDKVVVDGVSVRVRPHEYFLMHKPKGVLCTDDDPSGRVRAVDLLPELPVRLFLVGRLDADDSGLLMMTNDGELAQRITHPRFGIAKTYRAEVRGRVPSDLPAQMKKGIYLAEGKVQVSEVEIVHAGAEQSILMITLREGRNRMIRRMLARLGFRVKTLKRVQIGSLSLKGLPVGACRRLTPKELATLRQELGTGTTRQPQRKPAKRDRPVASVKRKPPPAPPRARESTPAPKRRMITLDGA